MGWLRIFTAVAIYLVVALVTSAFIKHKGSNLKSMEKRGSQAVLAIGALANVVVLVAVLLLLVMVDRRPIADLGLGFPWRAALFTLTSAALTLASAAGFTWLLDRIGLVEVEVKALPASSWGRLFTLAIVLLVVAMQEEVLYRGYITLSLLRHGPAVVLLVSTLVFTAIHFPTNRVSIPQVSAWLLGGLLLGWVYLASGSIWVAVLLHFAIDITNVLLFGVAGDLSLARLSRPLSDLNRAVYRVGHVVLLGAVVAGFYGFHLALR